MATKLPSLSRSLQRLYNRAVALAQEPELLSAFQAAAGNKRLWGKATQDARKFLESRGVSIPKGLAFSFLDRRPKEKREPKDEFFTIHLFDCHTRYAREGKLGYRIFEVCWGFEITPESD